MAFTLSTASNVLKVFYVGQLREQLNQKSVLYDRLRKDSSTQSVDGKTFTIALHTSRNQSAGAGRADGGTLPTAGQQGYTTAVVPNRYNYVRIEITGPTIRATRTNAGAFVRAVKSQVDGAMVDFTRSMNRMFHSDGTDALAYWTGADDTSGATVDDGQGNAFVHLDNAAQTLDLIDASDNSTVLGDSIVLTLGAEAAANYATTWTGTVSGSADGDYLVMEDTLGYQKQGIRGIISDGDPVLPTGGLHGLDVASYSYWKAQVVDNSGTNTALTLARMQKPLSKISVNSPFDESDVKFLLGNVFVKDEYIKLLVADKRHVNEMTLDGGQTAVSFNNKPLIVDPQCRRNVIYYVNPKTMAIFETSDGANWADFDGSMFSRVANKDSWEAFATHYGDAACFARNGNGLLRDITES